MSLEESVKLLYNNFGQRKPTPRHRPGTSARRSDRRRTALTVYAFVTEINEHPGGVDAKQVSLDKQDENGADPRDFSV